MIIIIFLRIIYLPFYLWWIQTNDSSHHTTSLWFCIDFTIPNMHQPCIIKVSDSFLFSPFSWLLYHYLLWSGELKHVPFISVILFYPLTIIYLCIRLDWVVSFLVFLLIWVSFCSSFSFSFLTPNNHHDENIKGKNKGNHHSNTKEKTKAAWARLRPITKQ